MNLTKKDLPFLFGIFFFGILFFSFYVWAMPLIDPDEPRYASTARDMALNGNWIVPHFNGVPRINKPPLFYWSVAVAFKIFGINEFSARLPSALAAIGTAMITYLWGKRCRGGNQSHAYMDGLWAGIVLMTSPLFFLIARFCITDMLLTFFVSASLYLFFIEYEAPVKSNRRRLCLYFLLAMVFLVKGPVGVLLFILITGSFLVWMRDFKYFRRLWYLPGCLLFLAIICAWGVPFWVSLGTKQIFALLSQETSGRFVSGYAHPEPFYYYGSVIVMGFFPWSLFACVAFVWFVKERNTFSDEEKKQIYFFCAWFLLTVFFFSLSHSKLMTYILPASPPLALLVNSLSRWEKKGVPWKRIRWGLWPALGISIAFPIGLIATMPQWVPVKYGLSKHHIAIPIIILLVGTLVAAFILLITRRFALTQRVFCLTNGLFLIFTIVFLSKYLGTFRSTKDIVAQCLLHKKEEYIFVSFDRITPSLVFYSGKPVDAVESDVFFRQGIPDQKPPVYLVMSMHDYLKKREWVEKKKFFALCHNNAHVVLAKEPH